MKRLLVGFCVFMLLFSVSIARNETETPSIASKYAIEKDGEEMSTCNHKWTSWWAASGSCNYTRRCEICNEREYKTEHTWVSNHHAQSSHPHWMVDKCSRCGEERVGSGQASWSWSYGSWNDHSSTQHRRTRSCNRSGCSHTETQTEGHTWGGWYSVDSTTERRDCSKCSRYETRSVECPHDMVYGSWQYDDADNCRRYRYCRMCYDSSVQTVEYLKHDYQSGGVGWVKCSRCGHQKGTGAVGTAKINSISTSSTTSSISASASVSYADVLYWQLYDNRGDVVSWATPTTSTSFSRSGLNSSSTYTIELKILNYTTGTSDTLTRSITTQTEPVPSPPIVDHVFHDFGADWGTVSVVGSNISRIEVTLSGGGTTQTGTEYGNMATVTFDGLKSNTSYSYTVVIYASSGASVTRSGSGSTTVPNTIEAFSVKSKTESTITISYRVTGSGSLSLTYTETRNPSITRVSLSGLSGEYTITGLKKATEYTIGLTFGGTTNSTIYCTTDFGNFSWQGAKAKKSGEPFDITAAEWRSLISFVNQKRRAKGLASYPLEYSYYSEYDAFYMPSGGGDFYWFCFNQMIESVKAMGASGLPSHVKSGDKVMAIDVNSLLNAINSVQV